MLRTVLGGKIHRATITQADLHYVGSITIDSDLVEAAGLVEGEKVQVVDITNGSRITTYVIYGEPGQIQINGAAAHLCRPGDLVIIAAYCHLRDDEILHHRATVIQVDPSNKIASTKQAPIAAP